MKITLTATEYELMTIIWNLGQASVRDVMEQLPKNRDLAYTSVATILRILEKKKILRYEASGRKHVFIPQISRDMFVKETTTEIIAELFDNDPLELVAYLLKDTKLNKKDLDSLKTLIEKKSKKS